VALRPGWLNRQFDQVSKNVDSWPDWMKRAAGFDSEVTSSGSENATAAAQPQQERDQNSQRTLNLRSDR
jgi:hypothetical protein